MSRGSPLDPRDRELEAGGLESKERFGNRVESYRSSRPAYPAQVYEFLAAELGLAAGSDVADLGSGTGIFCRPMVDLGARVWAVEPNARMRRAAEEELAGRVGFLSIAASAEQTTLGDSSVDLVTAAQAFHWFDVEAVRREVARILRSRGYAALVWNMRPEGRSAFLDEYEQFLTRWGRDYVEVKARYSVRAPERLGAFFAPGWRSARFEHGQELDREALVQRVLSSSYMPSSGDPSCSPMLADLERLFGRHAERGSVFMAYDAEVYCGRVLNG